MGYISGGNEHERRKEDEEDLGKVHDLVENIFAESELLMAVEMVR